MLKLIACIIIATLTARLCAQVATVSRHDLDITSAGHLFGATLSDDARILYVQQYARTQNESTFHTHTVVLSSWDVLRQTQLASRSVPESSQFATLPCNRTLLGSVSGRLYVCSGRTYISVLDPSSLSAIAEISTADKQAIGDFVVDEAKHQILIMTKASGASTKVSTVSLQTGDTIQETVLPSSIFAERSIALDSAHNVLVVAIRKQSGFGKTDLYFYDYQKLTLVGRLNDLPRLDDLLFAGSTLLAVPGYQGYRKNSCVLSIQPHSTSLKEEYCSPGTGVDLAGAIMGGHYLLAGTGINRPKLFSDQIVSVASSLSIWDLQTYKLLEQVRLPEAFTGVLSGLAISGARVPCFVAYTESLGSPHIVNGCLVPK